MSSVNSQSEYTDSVLMKSVFGEKGFYDGLHLKSNELQLLIDLIEKSWRNRLLEVYEGDDKACFAERVKQTSINHYHKLLDEFSCLNHKKLWPKKHRMLSPNDLKEVRTLPFMQWLGVHCGDFGIAYEEAMYDEEIYWRLARPSETDDVGPVHADRWFWELGHGIMPEGFQRIKLWLPLFCETGVNGLRYVPQSHLKEWPYIGVERDGFVKPQGTTEESELNLQAFQTRPGQAIIFNDDLLHGGLVGGIESRVSLEFTILVHLEACQKFLSDLG